MSSIVVNGLQGRAAKCAPSETSAIWSPLTAFERGIEMHPDDLPLCSQCGLDEMTHDRTVNHDFNAVGGSSINARWRVAPQSRLPRNGKRIILCASSVWLVGFAIAYYFGLI